MKILFVNIFFFVIASTGNFCVAQFIQQIVPSGTGSYGEFHSNDMLVMTPSDFIDLETADIDGSPFWDKDWKPAIIYTGDQAVFMNRVKLNLYKNTVYFMNEKDQAMIAKKGVVKKVEFIKGEDTSSILADFVYFKLGTSANEHFYQVLNYGKAELIKLDTVLVKKSLFDPSRGKEVLNYVTKTSYFIYYGANMRELKSFSKESLFSILQQEPAAEEWLKKNKNKLKSEKECVSFLEYFNAPPVE